ncbi:hypothetical protein K1W69_19155 [Hoeflea sp. WL0058]|uniref:Uncharacterized protein n=1 Tax=Flavimaribacter sediminis TaxID=2865987 RepID=A0AAE3D2Y7_9HYPH|nr:hypothetical protein [Flavimaribacter sediminis]MBW8639321.1 hypothetical protein [Flavimaribacter sediminis]
MGDRPYGRLPIKLERPDGSFTGARSNIDGFANFVTSIGNKDAEIYEAGVYSLRAVYPKGWQSLSDADQQQYEFVERANAGGGLTPVETCAPIGVAPILSVRGRFVARDDADAGNYEVLALGPDGAYHKVSTDTKGNYRFVAEPGNWVVEIRDADGATVSLRPVAVEYGAVVMSETILDQQMAPPEGSGARKLGFDDLVISDSLFEIPSGYGGLEWRNWIAVHNRFYSGSGYVNLTTSSEYVAYNSSGVPAWMASEEPFDFIGTYIGVAWPRGEEDYVFVKAWRGADLAYSDRLRLSDNGPVFFSADYRGITRLEFSSGNYERIVLDDFQFRLGAEQ